MYVIFLTLPLIGSENDIHFNLTNQLVVLTKAQIKKKKKKEHTHSKTRALEATKY